MLFANDDHYSFFKEKVEALKADCYLKALIYTIGVCDDTRCRWSKIYNEKSRSIDPDQLNQSWQTGTSAKVMRLAFQLFTDGTPTAYSGEDCEIEDFSECKKYSVSDVFCCEYAPYFMQAVQIRYPEYFPERSLTQSNNMDCADTEIEDELDQ